MELAKVAKGAFIGAVTSCIVGLIVAAVSMASSYAFGTAAVGIVSASAFVLALIQGTVAGYVLAGLEQMKPEQSFTTNALLSCAIFLIGSWLATEGALDLVGAAIAIASGWVLVVFYTIFCVGIIRGNIGS